MRRLATVVAFLVLSACGRDESTPPVEAQPLPETDNAGVETVLGPREPGPTQRAIQARGRLNCGIHQGLAGFALADNRGRWQGFDVDFCRAIAAAVLGDANAVRFVPLSARDQFEALRRGRVDVLVRGTPAGVANDAREGADVAAYTYFDGQGFLAARGLNLTSAAELSGARICVEGGSAAALNVEDYFQRRGLTYEPVGFASESEARRSFSEGRCDAVAGQISQLAALRATLANPDAQVLLPDIIADTASGPMVSEDDPQWRDAVRWITHALILAELTRDNVAEQAESQGSDIEVRRLLGQSGALGNALGLRSDWALRAIGAVGNYGEVFDRNLGPRSVLRLTRGRNALWSATPSGLIYAPPAR